KHLWQIERCKGGAVSRNCHGSRACRPPSRPAGLKAYPESLASLRRLGALARNVYLRLTLLLASFGLLAPAAFAADDAEQGGTQFYARTQENQGSVSRLRGDVEIRTGAILMTA